MLGNDLVKQHTFIVRLAFVILKLYIDSESKHPRLVNQMSVAHFDLKSQGVTTVQSEKA